MKTKIILTCEHAGYEIPAFLNRKIKIPRKKLHSHEGWDAGAFEICEFLKSKYNAKVFSNHITRLIIDYNRNLNNQAMKPTIRKLLTESEVFTLINDYQKYRSKIETEVEKSLSKGQKVIILSIHSFSPIFNDKTRTTEIGILFRKDIPKELSLAKDLKKILIKSGYKTHFNKPYRGNTDCLLNDILDKYKNEEEIT
ncbi:MAG: N-formylglutamate amidohydrolase, partial [Bdellovibrionota bacterium]|nr:N-formylglutamate amidohydrolase [Bdellovibrionota bacterium]